MRREQVLGDRRKVRLAFVPRAAAGAAQPACSHPAPSECYARISLEEWRIVHVAADMHDLTARHELVAIEKAGQCSTFVPVRIELQHTRSTRMLLLTTNGRDEVVAL